MNGKFTNTNIENYIHQNQGRFFAEYFFQIGIDPELIFEDFLYINDLKKINENLKIKPKIISKIPNIEKTTINIEEDIIVKHCFPNGFKCIESSKTPPCENFSFSLDNLLFPSHPKIYFNCLTFYESFQNFYNLKEKFDKNLFETNYDINKTIISNTDESNQSESSLSNSIALFDTRSHRSFLTCDFKKETYRPSIDTDIKLEFDFSDVRSMQMNHNYNINNYSVKSSGSKQSLRFKNFYAPKTICLCSFINFSVEQTKILKTIHKYTGNIRGKIRKPIEKILENLIYETPLPPRGIHQIEYNLINEKFILTQPPANSLPLVSLELEKIFNYFTIEQTVDIYTNILLERKVLFFSTDKSILSIIIEGFISLLYPFRYSHPTITVLPINDLYVLENFPSYVLGLNYTYTSSFFTDFNLEIVDSISIIDLDHKKILNYSPPNLKELSKFILLENISISGPTNNGNNSTQNSFKDKEDSLNLNWYDQIPRNHKNRLTEKIKNYIREIKLNTDKKEERENFIVIIQQIFYSFMVNLLIEYSNYIINSDEEFDVVNKILNTNSHSSVNHSLRPLLNINHIFKTKEFLSYAVTLEIPFYKKLFETKMFYNFIYKKLFPKNDEEKIEIIHFDEMIVKKNNKRIFSKTVYTPFLNSKKYEIKKTYTVNKSNTFTKEEMIYFTDPENIKKALRYGQEIIWENEKEMYIIYNIFPILVFDTKFFLEVEDNKISNLNSDLTSKITKNMKFPQNIYTDVSNVTGEILANSSTYLIYSNVGYKFNLQNKLQNIENYLYTSWIYIFAMTFHYCEGNEKPFRFRQLLDVIKKLNSIDEDTVNILILSTIRYGDDLMSIKLYELFFSQGLISSYTAYTYLVNKLSARNIRNYLPFDLQASKKQSLSSKRSNISLQPPASMHCIIVDADYQMKTRVMYNRSKSPTDMEKPVEIEFETEDNCIECNSCINIEVLCYDFEKMRKDALWASCPSCNNYTVPRLGVRTSSGGANENREKVVLYSPYNLKTNFSYLLRDFQLNLDLKVFRNKFNDLFWNSIWYFSQMELPYDFILPYEYCNSLDENEEVVLLDENENRLYVEKLSEIISPQSQNPGTEFKKDFFFDNLIEVIPFGIEENCENFTVTSNVVDLLIKGGENDSSIESNNKKSETIISLIENNANKEDILDKKRIVMKRNCKSFDFKNAIEKNNYNAVSMAEKDYKIINSYVVG